jgi:hypothetical protein
MAGFIDQLCVRRDRNAGLRHDPGRHGALMRESVAECDRVVTATIREVPGCGSENLPCSGWRRKARVDRGNVPAKTPRRWSSTHDRTQSALPRVKLVRVCRLVIHHDTSDVEPAHAGWAGFWPKQCAARLFRAPAVQSRRGN